MLLCVFDLVTCLTPSSPATAWVCYLFITLPSSGRLPQGPRVTSVPVDPKGRQSGEMPTQASSSLKGALGAGRRAAAASPARLGLEKKR